MHCATSCHLTKLLLAMHFHGSSLQQQKAHRPRNIELCMQLQDGYLKNFAPVACQLCMVHWRVSATSKTCANYLSVCLQDIDLKNSGNALKTPCSLHLQDGYLKNFGTSRLPAMHGALESISATSKTCPQITVVSICARQLS